MVGVEQCAEFSADFAEIQIEQTVFDVVGADRLIGARDFQFEASFGTSHFIAHGAQGLVVVFGVLSGAAGGRSAEHRGRKNKRGENIGDLHSWPPVLAWVATGSCAGAGKMGGRSVELSFFCTSSSEVRIAGDAAETGTEPDSAPQ